MTNMMRMTAKFRSTFGVPVSTIRYEYGFGFGDLYHPYTEALKLSTIAEGASLLADFYISMERRRAELNDWQALPVQAWRFGKTKRLERLHGRIPSIHFGPLSPEVRKQAQERVEHLFRLRDSVEGEGYVSKDSRPIDGVWVGKTFLILGGQHRVAVLNNLGWERIPVANLGRKNTPKKLVAKRLPLVKSGHLSLDDAKNILVRIEKGFGKDQANAWGFPFAGAPSLAGE
jgi:hypothetical protein